ncbi:MAG: preprotein translocase subunit SecE [Actinobacteria bacterium]|nr:preprotein translocase subunit SecE [Actinomycetota bacterium]
MGWKQFFKELPKRITKFFRDVVHELKRVTWPKRKDLWVYTIVVLVTIVFFAIVLGLFDFIFLRIVELLARS